MCYAAVGGNGAARRPRLAFVLGLRGIGPLAAKPVRQGKGCLFKKFAGIDVFDIALAQCDPDKPLDIIAAMEPPLGGVNREDIKAPECLSIEQRLRERLNSPLFHDDPRGKATTSSAPSATTSVPTTWRTACRTRTASWPRAGSRSRRATRRWPVGAPHRPGTFRMLLTNLKIPSNGSTAPADVPWSGGKSKAVSAVAEFIAQGREHDEPAKRDGHGYFKHRRITSDAGLPAMFRSAYPQR